MGIITDLAKQQDGRAGVKLPRPTKGGDNTVIAAKTGEYVLPPKVVKYLGVENIDAWVESITGKKPGGKPVEGMQELTGHALGGLINDLDDNSQPKGGLARSGISSPTTTPAGTPSTQSMIDDKYRAERLNPGSARQPLVASAAPPKPAVPPAPASQNRGYRIGNAVGTTAGPLIRKAAGIASTLAKGAAVTSPVTGFGDYKIDDPGVDSSVGGVISNLARGQGRTAWEGIKKGAVEAGLDSVSGMAKTADSVAGFVGADLGLQRAFDRRVQADIGPMLAKPAQNAVAPSMTDQQRSDEIAYRRAALESPQTYAAPTAYAASAAPERAPATGLASRAAKPAAAPAVPASVPPMDGAVEIIRGHNRSWAVPELGYQEVPEEVYRSGRIAEYAQAQSNNMIDRADPVAAELRTRLAEINARGDNSIRVSNATDRDAAGRGLRTEAARLELEQRKREASLVEQALDGNQEAIQRLNLLRGQGRGGNDYAATTREVPIDPNNPALGTVREPVLYSKRTGEFVQSNPARSSNVVPQSAIMALRQNPLLATQFDAKYGKGAAAHYLDAR